MLRKPAFDDLVEPVIFFASQEAQATDSLATVADLPCGIDCGLVIVDSLAVAKRDKGLIAVCRGGCFAVRAEPAV